MAGIRIRVLAKCSDCCSVIASKDDDVFATKSGCVPRNIRLGGGDCVEFTVDNDTGKIVGWHPLTQRQLEDALQ